MTELSLHPNLITYHGRTQDPDNRLCLITEISYYGTLDQMIYNMASNNEYLSNGHILIMAIQISEAMI